MQSIVSSEAGGMSYITYGYNKHSRRRRMLKTGKVTLVTWQRKGEESAGICFVWPNCNCSYESAIIGYVSCCLEMKIMRMKSVMGTSRRTRTTETAPVSSSSTDFVAETAQTSCVYVRCVKGVLSPIWCINSCSKKAKTTSSEHKVFSNFAISIKLFKRNISKCA